MAKGNGKTAAEPETAPAVTAPDARSTPPVGAAGKREALAEALAVEDQSRAQECGREIAAVLDKHRCRLEAVPHTSPLAGAPGLFALAVRVTIVAGQA
jgi:hypothetical protein